MDEVQEHYLNLMKEFDAICEKNNLKYFIIGGTLIGAIRHHGFVPWDDDVDIAMPRRDYDLLIKKSEEWVNYPYAIEHYSLEKNTLKNNDSMIMHFVNNTIIIEQEKNNRIYKERLSIDILPIDGAPNNIIHRGIYYFHLLILRALFKFTMIEEVDENENDRNLFEKMLIKFMRFIKVGHILDSRVILKNLDDLLRKYDIYNNYQLAGTFLGAYRQKEIVNCNYWRERQRYVFEDAFFWGPKDYDGYLKTIYGDYMILPPENERVGKHHILRIKNTNTKN